MFGSQDRRTVMGLDELIFLDTRFPHIQKIKWQCQGASASMV